MIFLRLEVPLYRASYKNYLLSVNIRIITYYKYIIILSRGFFKGCLKNLKVKTCFFLFWRRPIDKKHESKVIFRLRNHLLRQFINIQTSNTELFFKTVWILLKILSKIFQKHCTNRIFCGIIINKNWNLIWFRVSTNLTALKIRSKFIHFSHRYPTLIL